MLRFCDSIIFCEIIALCLFYALVIFCVQGLVKKLFGDSSCHLVLYDLNYCLIILVNMFCVFCIVVFRLFSGSPQNTGTATLIVTVGDVNDNFPDFAADYQPTLTENTDFNDYSVITLSAVDADNATNGQPFSFELACNHEGASAQCSKFRLDFNPCMFLF